MEEFGFATHTGGEEYQIYCSENLDELFSKAKYYLPIRSSFEKKLQKGITSVKGYLKITDPEPDQPGGQDGFEIILGRSRQVTQYVLEARNTYLEKKLAKLALSNQQAAEVIRKVADGKITPDQLKKATNKIIEPIS